MGDKRPTDADGRAIPSNENAPAPKARVVVLRYRYFDPAIGAERTGVYGYRAVCPCSWEAERRQVWRTARRDLAAHLDWHQQARETEA